MQADEADIRDRVAIVTGAGRGVGRGIALRLARAGARVVIATRTPENGERVAAEIEQAGGTALAIPCDVRRQEQIDAVVAGTLERFGTVHALFNAAQTYQGGGLSNNKTAIEDVPDEWWTDMFASGLHGAIRFSNAVLPAMKEQRYGKIVNFSSHAGISGAPGTIVYNCVKEAVRAFTKTAAREWGPHGVRVNVVCPSAMTDAVVDSRARYSGGQPPAAPPLGYYGDPEKDVGGLAVFLVSGDSDYMTANTLFPAGGLYFLP
jgi:2-hydroxycyclohexanecarboxyl-CoA dehydrogenase